MNLKSIKDGYTETCVRIEEIKSELAKRFPAFALLKHLEETKKTYEVILRGVNVNAPTKAKPVENVPKDKRPTKMHSLDTHVLKVLKEYDEPIPTSEIEQLLPVDVSGKYGSKTSMRNAIATSCKSLLDRSLIQRKNNPNKRGYLYWH